MPARRPAARTSIPRAAPLCVPTPCSIRSSFAPSEMKADETPRASMRSKPSRTQPAAPSIFRTTLRSSARCSIRSTASCARNTGLRITPIRGLQQGPTAIWKSGRHATAGCGAARRITRAENWIEPPNGDQRQLVTRDLSPATCTLKKPATGLLKTHCFWHDGVRGRIHRMNSHLDVAVETAREAGAILLAEFDRPVKISYKGEVDIVTQADRRSEEAIVSRLRSHFPKHSIVAEEGSGAESESPFRWHVDPLDGTTNFAHGYPCFAVSIGLEEAGELTTGVVYQPITGELFTAVKGEGAHLNQKKIEVSRVEKLATSLLATGFPSAKRAQSP